MNDFTLDELKLIWEVMIKNGDARHLKLIDRIRAIIDDQEALANMDFNDCGDACKL